MLTRSTNAIALAVLLASASCTMPLTSKQMVTGGGLFTGQAREQLSVQDGDLYYGNLFLAAEEAGIEVEGVPRGLDRTPRGGGDRVLTARLADAEGIRKMLRVQIAAVRGKDVGDSIAFSQDDMEEIAPALLEAIGIGGETVPVIDSGTGALTWQPSYLANQRTTVWRIGQEYLVAYFGGKFVDRSGAEYSQPKLTSTVGNDTITAFLAVALEALLDSLYSPPVFYEDPALTKVITPGGKEPTAATLGFAAKQHAAAAEFVTKAEAQAIQYLAGLASEQSKTLAGFVIRLFGDLELSFVIGAHFSFGDNDTLAKVVETFFARSARRAAEAGAFRVFRLEKGDSKRFQQLLDIIKKVLP